MSVASGKYNAHGDFFLSAPYNRVLVQRIKLRVPAKHRTYRGETKMPGYLALAMSYLEHMKESAKDVDEQ